MPLISEIILDVIGGEAVDLGTIQGKGISVREYCLYVTYRKVQDTKRRFHVTHDLASNERQSLRLL